MFHVVYVKSSGALWLVPLLRCDDVDDNAMTLRCVVAAMTGMLPLESRGAMCPIRSGPHR